MDIVTRAFRHFSILLSICWAHWPAIPSAINLVIKGALTQLDAVAKTLAAYRNEQGKQKFTAWTSTRSHSNEQRVQSILRAKPVPKLSHLQDVGRKAQNMRPSAAARFGETVIHLAKEINSKINSKATSFIFDPAANKPGVLAWGLSPPCLIQDLYEITEAQARQSRNEVSCKQGYSRGPVKNKTELNPEGEYGGMSSRSST
jgi:hypothetical protein